MAPRVRRAVTVAGLVLATLGMPGVGRGAGSTVSGVVTTLANGSPVEGAFVTIAGPDQPPKTDTTDVTGHFSIAPDGDGPFSVDARARGFGQQSRSGVTGADPVSFSLLPSTFTPLPVDAGGFESIAADTTSGVFYGTAKPELYRSDDYGGSWQPVPLRYEDPATGLSTVGGGNVVTSGVPGEVATASRRGTISYSRDFGLTWNEVGGSMPGGHLPDLFVWDHASPSAADDVLVAGERQADATWRVWRADLTAGSPALSEESSDPFGTGSVVDAAEAATGAFIGRVDAAGDLSFAPITPTDPITFDAADVTGLPSPPQMLRLGGAPESSAPPDGALVVGGSGPFDAVMLAKDPGQAAFSGGTRSDPTALDDCHVGDFLPPVSAAAGSVAPSTSGSSGLAQAKSCWLRLDGAGPLDVVATAPAAFDIAFDADWGPAGNRVAIGGFGEPFKLADLDANGFPTCVSDDGIADPGTDPGSCGTSIHGLVSPSVADTAYGPNDPSTLAVALHVERGLASTDGGETMTAAVGVGTNAVQWWEGPTTEWLVFGGAATHSPSGRMLSALADWDGATTLAEANVDGSTRDDLGGTGVGPYGVLSLEGVSGTDTLFMGLGTEFQGDPSHLYRGTLVAGDPPSLTDRFSFDTALADAGITIDPPDGLAYCPDGSDPDIADALFVTTSAVSNEPQGALIRIAAAGTGAPAATVVDAVPYRDVRADCPSGTVYAARSDGNLMKSTDGGATFTSVLTLPHEEAPVAAVGLNPANPDDVTVAAGDSAILHSADGGATWTVTLEAALARPAEVEDIEYPPSAPAIAKQPKGTPLHATAETASQVELALLATGAGALLEDVSARRGIIGVSRGAHGPWLGHQITQLAADSHPAMAVDPATGRYDAVFHRIDGLYATASMAGSGSWSLPAKIPGTTGADDRPALARDPGGGLELAFQRTGARPGVYYSHCSSAGIWAGAPTRISSTSGDALPAIGVTGSSKPVTHIAFLRSNGDSPGVYYAAGSRGMWSQPTRVRGTVAADAATSRGGPTLSADSHGTVHLAFARAGDNSGIYYAERSPGGWSVPTRLTATPGDQDPSITTAAGGNNQIVFRRPGGAKAQGIMLLTGRQSWSLSKVPGTRSSDLQPALSLTGSTLTLAFVRPTGTLPGVYFDRKAGSGPWLSKPARRSDHADDRSPVVRSDAQGQVSLLFERA